MIALVSSAGSWFKNIEWKKYGDYSHYLTLPGKGLPLYFNGTTATLHAVLGNIAAVGISKFLLSGHKPRVSTLKARPVGEIISWKGFAGGSCETLAHYIVNYKSGHMRKGERTKVYDISND